MLVGELKAVKGFWGAGDKLELWSGSEKGVETREL